MILSCKNYDSQFWLSVFILDFEMHVDIKQLYATKTNNETVK